MKPRLVPLVIVALALFALLAGYATTRSPSPAYATSTPAASANTAPSAADPAFADGNCGAGNC
jgi:hypothetical protein